MPDPQSPPAPAPERESLTPRTDALCARQVQEVNHPGGQMEATLNMSLRHCLELRHHARTLERELTEESARVDALHKTGYALQERAEAAERERDAINETYERLEHELTAAERANAELRAALEIAQIGLYNAFEPDNQSNAYKAVIRALKGTQTEPGISADTYDLIAGVKP